VIFLRITRHLFLEKKLINSIVLKSQAADRILILFKKIFNFASHLLLRLFLRSQKEKQNLQQPKISIFG